MEQTSSVQGAVCIPNIGPLERRKRLLMGMAMLAVSIIIIGSALFLSDAHRLWRLALFVPFWLAAIGIFQAREKT